jgi:hypothetical protein
MHMHSASTEVLAVKSGGTYPSSSECYIVARFSADERVGGEEQVATVCDCGAGRTRGRRAANGARPRIPISNRYTM